MADSDEQRELLRVSTGKVKEQAFYMKRAMDQNDLKEALKFAKDMLKELKTPSLTPRNYYDLYMKVMFFGSERVTMLVR